MDAGRYGRFAHLGVLRRRGDSTPAATARPSRPFAGWMPSEACEAGCEANHEACRLGCEAIDGECQDECNHRRKRCRISCRRGVMGA